MWCVRRSRPPSPPPPTQSCQAVQTPLLHPNLAPAARRARRVGANNKRVRSPSSEWACPARAAAGARPGARFRAQFQAPCAPQGFDHPTATPSRAHRAAEGHRPVQHGEARRSTRSSPAHGTLPAPAARTPAEGGDVGTPSHTSRAAAARRARRRAKTARRCSRSAAFQVGSTGHESQPFAEKVASALALFAPPGTKLAHSARVRTIKHMFERWKPLECPRRAAPTAAKESFGRSLHQY